MPLNAAGMDIGKIDDSQIDMMKGVMQTDSGRDMLRNMMKSQYGMDISDEQLSMMSGMMNKDTFKMASQQMKNSPGGIPGFPTTPRPQDATVIGTGQTPVQQPGGGMEEMMKSMAGGEQPGVDTLMKNKDMIKMMFGMMKSNPAMIRQMTAGMGGSHPVSKFIQGKSDQQLQTLAKWLERAIGAVFFCYPAFKFLKDNIKILLGLFVAYLVYRYIL